jgi:hypothetical protein
MADAFLLEPSEISELNERGMKKLERLFFHCNTLLGGLSIPVQLERTDYMFTFESALNMYRTRSSRSINQTFGFLDLQIGQSSYQLHERVDVVKKINRSGGAFGGIGQIGGFESFGAATANTILRGATGGAGAIDLPTFDFFAQYQETLARIFATEINFHFRPENNSLVIHQVPKRIETVMLELSVLKTVDELLNDHWAYNWLQQYTLAVSKTVLGEKLSLFATVAGPQGGTVTKGEQLKQAGHDEMIYLEDELMNWGDSGDIPLPIRG